MDITFQGSSSGVTSQTLKRGNDVTIKCHVDLSSRYVPLVQWFHDPNEDADGKFRFSFGGRGGGAGVGAGW